MIMTCNSMAVKKNNDIILYDNDMQLYGNVNVNDIILYDKCMQLYDDVYDNDTDLGVC